MSQIASKVPHFTHQQVIEAMMFSILDIEPSRRLPLILWGIHGIGKTEIIKELAKELPWTDKDGNERKGWNIVIKHLALDDTIDILGIPKTVKGPNGEDIQKWAIPVWLAEANRIYEETGQPTLVFLDEFNRGQRMVLQGMLPFLIEGRIGEHHLNPASGVVCACNPVDENYDTNDIFDKALLDRCGHCVLRPSHEEYINYLKSTGMDATTIKVVGANPKYTEIPDTELNFRISPSRRKIDFIFSKIKGRSRKWIIDHGQAILDAYVGEEFRDEWMVEFMNTDESITIEMVKNYKDNEEDITRILTREIDGEESTRLDILGKVTDMISVYIQDAKQLKASDVDWICDFLGNRRVPDETVASVLFSEKKILASSIFDTKVNKRIGTFVKDKNLEGSITEDLAIYK